MTTSAARTGATSGVKSMDWKIKPLTRRQGIQIAQIVLGSLILALGMSNIHALSDIT